MPCADYAPYIVRAELKRLMGGVERVAELTGRKHESVPREGGGVEFVTRSRGEVRAH